MRYMFEREDDDVFYLEIMQLPVISSTTHNCDVTTTGLFDDGAEQIAALSLVGVSYYQVMERKLRRYNAK